MFKKSISILLSLIMILSVFTIIPASAAVIEDTSVGIESGLAADETETEESFSVDDDSDESESKIKKTLLLYETRLFYGDIASMVDYHADHLFRLDYTI